jgi:hypothetical protein
MPRGWKIPAVLEGFTAEFDRHVWQALDHGVEEMAAALTQAVSCDLPCRNK